MKLRLVIMFCVLAWAYPACAESPLPVDDPDALRAMLDKPGSIIVISGEGWDKILDHLADGDLRWMKFIKKEGCCGGNVEAGEGFPIVMSVALTRSPEDVMRTFPELIPEICSVEFIEPTKEEYDAQIKALKVAMLKVKDPALQKKKAECIKSIDTAGPWRDVSKLP